MKNYIITSGSIRRTVVARLQAMKSDWNTFSSAQRCAYINRMLTGYSLSQTQRDAIAAFLRDNDDAQRTLTLNCKELICNTTENSLEFLLVEIYETYPTIREVTDEEYNRFSEDAEDEATK